ncbi:MAG TPA: dihydrolipoamide acetyltransferase family protein [Steroidobacteraceae bacterium]|nr:dihydrolipoamide acetyltransferase family protein [Steroidobacteraceae bacterium]
MPLVAVEIPKIGLVMETVRVTRWLKSVGDTVKAGEALLEVETEKSVVEIEASVSGRLDQIVAPVGQEAKVGDQVAWVDSPEAAAIAASRPELPARNSAIASTPSAPRAVPASGRVLSTPAARRFVAERGLDLKHIAGSGPGGRVQLADVTQPQAGASPPPAVPGPALPAAGMSRMQRALARAMSLSNATVPQFTVERSLDCTALQAVQTKYRASIAAHEPSLSVNDFMLQAVARALIEMPAMNATYSDDQDGAAARIVAAVTTRIGLVVAIEGGLLVPVFRDVERLGLKELSRQRRDGVERALKGRLKREELSGATCSISNLGARGPDRFAAMINPPESAILAVGRQRDGVVARAGGFAVRPLSELTLTVDHRVANGRLAAEFLARVVEILEARDWPL